MSAAEVKVYLHGPRIRDWIGDSEGGRLLAPVALGGGGLGNLGGGVYVVMADLPGGEVALMVTRLLSIRDPLTAPVDRIVTAALSRVRAYAGELVDLALDVEVRVKR